MTKRVANPQPHGGKIGRTWPRKLTPEQRHRIAWRYRKGEQVKAIACDYKVHVSYVSILARRKGLEMRDRPHRQ